MLPGTRTAWLGGLFSAGLLLFIPQATTAADVCCAVVSVNNANGKITARDVKTNQTFDFIVDSRRLTSSLRIGQKVYADFVTGKIGFSSTDLCCTIIGAPKVRASAPVDEGHRKSVVESGSDGPAPEPVSVVNDRRSAAVPQPDFGDVCCSFNPSSRATSTGRIVLDLPGEAGAWVEILSEGKRATEGTWSHDGLSFPPGNYKVLVSGAEVSVPVRKGMDTRIRAGVLRITVDGWWEVYDQHGTKRLKEGSGDSSFGMPVGRYQLKQNKAAFSPVVIRDNETTDF